MLGVSLVCRRKWPAAAVTVAIAHRSSPPLRRGFRSKAALESLQALVAAADGGEGKPSLVLYNYPAFAGAFAALFAHLYHSRLQIPSLILPFSSVEPLRVGDFRSGCIETCYLLDFIGHKCFAEELAKVIPRVVAFDHRQSTLLRTSKGIFPKNVELRIDTSKNSARATFDYFSEKFTEEKGYCKEHEELLNPEEKVRIEKIISYIEDADLRKWNLAGVKEFHIGIREARAKLNSVTNPYMFKQLMELDADDLIARGNFCIASRQGAANKLLLNPFKIQLGRGLYGECLAVRADGNPELSHELAEELSRRSAAAGLRPIGAVIFIQRGNLKMCLRTTDCATDTSVIAKAYGGGGKPSSSSFIIRMDEYNEWTAINLP
ncbi:hypothetical protein AXF42_Ash011675 [Apostasia shenzhenica]|uniref:Uncharacterized protein n=1 Tax=Apostasia shenzhenica TaxID=1088818 RepID=A0A2H9ZUM5_9ASPA|nr:hypothetical protein AXF42_Ash011675 [Apostasia shenzhenica]